MYSNLLEIDSDILNLKNKIGKDAFSSIMVLAIYMDAETNIIVINNKHPKNSEIIRTLGYSQSKGKKVIEELISNNIIKFIDGAGNRLAYINPNYIHKKGIDTDIYKIFT